MKNVSKRSSEPKIQLTARGHNLDVDRYDYELRFRTIKGQMKRISIGADEFYQPTKVRALLAGEGAILPPEHKEALEVVKSALASQPRTIKPFTGRTGWLLTEDEQTPFFVLPRFTTPRSDNSPKFKDAFQTKASPHTRSGSLADWKHGLELHCRASSYLVFGIALGLSGPLLEPLGISESAVIRLRGRTSTGKTSVEEVTESVVDNPQDLMTMDATSRRFDELAASRNDLTLTMDEWDRLQGSIAEKRKLGAELTYKIPSGKGGQRSRKAQQDPDLADQQWRAFALTSVEIKTDPFTKKQKRLLDDDRSLGERVRLIDIPVPIKEKGGIFDLLKFQDRQDSLSPVDRLKSIKDTIYSNYGVAIRPFVRNFAASYERDKKKARAIVNTFVQEQAPGGGWQGRVTEKFGVVLAAADLAVDYGVAPWTKKHAKECVTRLLKRALQIAYPPEALFSDVANSLSQLAKNEERLPIVERGEKLPKRLREKSWGIRRELDAPGPFIAVKKPRLIELAGSASAANMIIDELKRRGWLIPDSENNGTRQIKLQGFGSNRPRFVCILTKFLED